MSGLCIGEPELRGCGFGVRGSGGDFIMCMVHSVFERKGIATGVPCGVRQRFCHVLTISYDS